MSAEAEATETAPAEPGPPSTPAPTPAEIKEMSPEVEITKVYTEEKAPREAKPSPASPSSPFVPSDDADMGAAMSKLKKKLAAPSPESKMEYLLAKAAKEEIAEEDEQEAAPVSDEAHKTNAGRGQEILKTISTRQLEPPASPAPATDQGGEGTPAPASPIKWQGWDEGGAMTCDRLTNDAEELSCQRRVSGQPAVYGGMCSMLNKKGEWEDKYLSVSDGKLWAAAYFSVPPLSILSRPKVEASVGQGRHGRGTANRAGHFTAVADLAAAGVVVNFQAAPGTPTGFVLVVKPVRGDAVKLAPKRFQALLEWGAVFSQTLTEAPAGSIQDRVALLQAQTRASMFGPLDPTAQGGRSALDSLARVSRPLVDTGLFTQPPPPPALPATAPAPSGALSRGDWVKDQKAQRRRARSQGRPPSQAAASLQVPTFAPAVVKRRGQAA